jgi:hypothetical protein
MLALVVVVSTRKKHTNFWFLFSIEDLEDGGLLEKFTDDILFTDDC